MIYFTTCASRQYSNVKRLNIDSALKFGVDRIIDYNFDDIEKSFIEKNKAIFDYKDGNGCYIWKPYFINRALDQIRFGDYLIYGDAAILFVNNIQPLIEIMQKEKLEFMPFVMCQNPEKMWTKWTVFEYLGCTSTKYMDSSQLYAGFMVMKKGELACNLMRNWLGLAQKETLISKTLSEEDIRHGSVTNKYDQSIYSLLIKKQELVLFRDPSQWGSGKKKKLFPEDVIQRSTYQQIINIHRQRNCNSIPEILLKQFFHDQGAKIKSIIQSIK